MARSERGSSLYQDTPLQCHFEVVLLGKQTHRTIPLWEALALLAVLKQSSLSIDVRSGPSPPVLSTIMSSSQHRWCRNRSTISFNMSGATEGGRSTVCTVPWQS